MASRHRRVNAGSRFVSERVVIIGAGIGGLAAAVLLSARGCDVTVIEKEAAPGGKMRQVSPAGRPIDAGPTVFTMRWVFDEIFAGAGASFEDSIGLTQLDTLARHAWDADQRLDLHSNAAASVDAIAAFAGPDEGRRFAAFLAQAARTYRTLERPFLRGSATNPIGLSWRIGPAHIGDMMSIQPFASLWRKLGQYFHDPRLRQLFGRYATYSGASPFAAPATLMLIAHVEQAGVWSVAGGMHAVARAFETLAVKSGARFHYGSGCKTIETSRGNVSGVILDNGTRIAADRIVANCDPSALGSGLLGSNATRAAKPVPPRDRSLSALVWVADAPTSGFPLSRHNVFFSPDYAREFAEIGSGRLPSDPTAYVCAQDRDQAEPLTPGAPERLQIIVNAPARGDTHPHTPEEIAACQAAMTNRLTQCGLMLNLSDRMELTTPTGFNALFPASGGALYGRATHGWAAAFRRPGARTAIPGLYLAGGGTHPGAGVPMAALSGWQAADSLIADLASIRTSSPAVTAGGISTRSAKTGVTG
jgi:1-hydroxycarotenoid 3,4-desaturase